MKIGRQLVFMEGGAYGSAIFLMLSDSRKLIKRHKKWSLFLILAVCLFFSGCNKASYPEEKVESAIKEICLKEYKIDHVEVRFAGKTINVFLPLEKLFEGKELFLAQGTV